MVWWADGQSVQMMWWRDGVMVRWWDDCSFPTAKLGIRPCYFSFTFLASLIFISFLVTSFLIFTLEKKFSTFAERNPHVLYRAEWDYLGKKPHFYLCRNFYRYFFLICLFFLSYLMRFQPMAMLILVVQTNVPWQAIFKMHKWHGGSFSRSPQFGQKQCTSNTAGGP